MGVPFKDLNELQKKAVIATGRRILVLAGPGTGKTEVLGQRTNHLIKQRRVNPSKILAITFTMKAAQEMRNRLKEFRGSEFRKVRILTIHGEAWGILNQNSSDKIDIADDDESKMVMKDAFNELDLEHSPNNLRDSRQKIEMLKADNILPEDMDVQNNGIFRLYQEYEKLLHFNKVTDFGGILTTTLCLLGNGENLKKCHDQTKYILVDEYQDINKAQFEFIRSLCHRNSELFCVGDDDQSIYRWRGGKPDFILDFEEDFDDAQSLPLEESRRCSGNILTAALNLISNNKRNPKKLYSNKKNGDPVYILKSSSEIQEARWIAYSIKKKTENKQIKPSEIAIICRDTDLASHVVGELKKLRVPVEYWKEGALFKDRQIKDIFAHLKVVANPNNNLALRRCLLSKSIENIGDQRVDELRKKALEQNKPIWDILQAIKAQASSMKWEMNIVSFVKWIEELKTYDSDIRAVIHKIIEKLKPPEDDKNIQKMKNMLENLSKKSVKWFLREVVIKRRLDFADGGPEPEDKGEAVAVMSMHSSKGLTYRIVFIVGLEEKIFPKSDSNLEEERRICYVAMTRAKEKLFLCHASRRKGRAAQGFGLYHKRSRFIDEITPCETKTINNFPKKKNKRNGSEKSSKTRL